MTGIRSNPIPSGTDHLAAPHTVSVGGQWLTLTRSELTARNQAGRAMFQMLGVFAEF